MIELTAPPFLNPGDRIRVVAPSSPFDKEAFEAGVRLLRTRYEVVHQDDIFERKAYLAGDDARRLLELDDALADEKARCILAARGGYGAGRIAYAIGKERIRSANKWLVGFSDVTALHGAWANAGVASVHGPMVASLGKDAGTSDGDARFARLCGTLEGTRTLDESGLVTLRPGRASGRLLGGNLSVLVSLAGTPLFPRLDGAVLFVEDIGERPYRVDRMLTQLKAMGALDSLAGLVFGAFTDCGPGIDGRTAEDVIAERAASLDVPVVSGLSAGHIDDNLPLVFGRAVTLDATAGTIRQVD